MARSLNSPMTTSRLPSKSYVTRRYLDDFAKTAHCATVAKLGLDGFQPYLTDIILGRSSCSPWFYAGVDPYPDNDGNVAPMEVSSINDGQDYAGTILVKIRLFTDLHAPPYVVVSGKKA